MLTGTYGATSGQRRKCSSCRPGSYTSNEGQTECSLCSPGFSQPDAGKTHCMECFAGTFQPEEGKVRNAILMTIRTNAISGIHLFF